MKVDEFLVKVVNKKVERFSVHLNVEIFDEDH